MTSTKTNILFVDDEVHLINGLRRMLYKQRQDWNMYFALSGAEALEIMSKNPIDILVTDMRMPQMNGAELLNIVIAKYPNTIRIILSGHSDEEMILKSVRTAHKFIAKPTDTDSLITAINRTLQLRELLFDSNILNVINGILELPSIPAIYLKLEQELNSSNVSLSKVAELISNDVSISAKILQIVNSAFFGLPKETADVTSAVNMLGTNIIRSIIISLKFQNFVTDKEAKVFSLDKLWLHSQLVAKLAQEIYEKHGDKVYSGKEAYAAGLLHDIGKIILLKHSNYVEAILSQGNDNLSEIEYRVLKISHAEIGAYLLGIWNLPIHLVEAVAQHHKPENFSNINLACSVYLANKILSSKQEGSVDLSQEIELGVKLFNETLKS